VVGAFIRKKLKSVCRKLKVNGKVENWAPLRDVEGVRSSNWPRNHRKTFSRGKFVWASRICLSASKTTS